MNLLKNTNSRQLPAISDPPKANGSTLATHANFGVIFALAAAMACACFLAPEVQCQRFDICEAELIARLAGDAGLPQPSSPSSAGSGRLASSAVILKLMTVTAYCPCAVCCGAFADGVTASGHVIADGDAFCAADRSVAFGTPVLIPGYNNDTPVRVEDRGGAIRGDRIDVFFATHDEALDWGVRELDVLFLNHEGHEEHEGILNEHL